MTWLLLLAGLALLVAGGEILVRGAGALARSFGVSPLVVGLTVVAFATSTPELAVTLQATLDGNPGLAVGNVIGSNTANILLVLGLAGVITPLAVQLPVIRRDVPVLVALSGLMVALGVGGVVDRVEGAALLALLLAYSVWAVVRGRQTGAASTPGDAPVPAPGAAPGPRVPVALALVAVGVGLLVLGARLLVDGATEIAGALGMSDLVIGLTVVAVGTSLPELATSVIAAVRGDVQMAVGNAVGSCIFNIGAVLGLTAVIAPDGVPIASSALRFDAPVMVAVALALLPVAFTGMRIARWEAALFVVLYAAYVTYLLLDSTGHSALPQYSAVMLAFVLPLVALTLVVLATYELGVLRGRREAARAP